MNNYRSNLTQFLHPYKSYCREMEHLLTPFDIASKTTWKPKRFRRIEKLLYFQDWFLRLHEQTHNFEYRRLAGKCMRKLYALGVDAPIFIRMEDYNPQT